MIRAIAILFTGLLWPFFVFADIPPNIPPEQVQGFRADFSAIGGESNVFFSEKSEAITAGCSRARTYVESLATYIDDQGCDLYQDGATYDKWAYTYRFRNDEEAPWSGVTSKFFWIYDNEPSYQCTNPDYPIPVDSNNDGEIDECAPDACMVDDPLWSSDTSINSPTGRICTQQPDGSVCEYQAIEHNGSTSEYVFRPTGESCECSEFGPIPCVEQDEDGNSMNEDQDQDCVQTDDLIMCSADPSDHCDEQGVCDTGCGYINDNFVCTETADENEAPCTANDERMSCDGVPEGECPVGYFTCGSESDENDLPEDQDRDGDGVPDGVTAEEIARLNAKLAEDIGEEVADKLLGEPVPNPAEWTDAMKSTSDTLNDEITDFYEADDASQFSDMLTDGQSQFESKMLSALPDSGQCSPINISTPNGPVIIDHCPAANVVKPILEWAFYLFLLLGIWRAFSIQFTPNS